MSLIIKNYWCEKRDLNPHVETPDPKSGASANSATLADDVVLMLMVPLIGVEPITY